MECGEYAAAGTGARFAPSLPEAEQHADHHRWSVSGFEHRAYGDNGGRRHGGDQAAGGMRFRVFDSAGVRAARPPAIVSNLPNSRAPHFPAAGARDGSFGISEGADRGGGSFLAEYPRGPARRITFKVAEANV